MKIEKKKDENVIEIQEEIRIIQDDQEIILEKGDRIEILSESFEYDQKVGTVYGFTNELVSPEEVEVFMIELTRDSVFIGLKSKKSRDKIFVNVSQLESIIRNM